MNRKPIVFMAAVITLAHLSGINSEEPLQKSARHKYTIQVLNQGGSPVEGAAITFLLQSASENPLPLIHKATAADGMATAYVDVPAIYGSHSTEHKFTSYLDYTVEKEGYAPQKGSLLITSNDELGFSVKKVTLTDIKTIRTVNYIASADFFADDFPESREGQATKEQVINILDTLLLEGYLSDVSLQTSSIQLIQSEEQQYLTFRFSAVQPFLFDQFSNEKLCAAVFDRIVSKIIKPLSKIDNRGLFYGYSLSFIVPVQTNTTPPLPIKKTVCRFLVTSSAARKYANNSMEKHQFLDKSSVYVDNKPISFSLHE
ncbi:hypothetical protein KDK77_04690 [bacterium]|nr:hypothetical protein [bacterium]MCP5461672.1 hypothetical protein [bacterium]